MALKYQRILLKISGEALGGEKGTGVLSINLSERIFIVLIAIATLSCA